MTRTRLTPQLLQWFGVFGAPFAWAGQHAVGFFLTIAACDPTGGASRILIDTITGVVSAVMAVVAALAGAAAVVGWAQTRGTGNSDPPPRGRRHFLAIVGMTITPLFFAMIVMSGSGVLHLTECRQS